MMSICYHFVCSVRLCSIVLSSHQSKALRKTSSEQRLNTHEKNSVRCRKMEKTRNVLHTPPMSTPQHTNSRPRDVVHDALIHPAPFSPRLLLSIHVRGTPYPLSSVVKLLPILFSTSTGLQLLLWVLNTRLGAFLLTGRAVPFPAQSFAARHALLRRWSRSRVGKLREAFQVAEHVVPVQSVSRIPSISPLGCAPCSVYLYVPLCIQSRMRGASWSLACTSPFDRC